MVYIDSDLIIDFLRKEEKMVRFFRDMEESGGSLKTTAINSFEVLKGVSRHTNPEKYEKVVQFLSQFIVSDFTFETSEKAAEIFEQLKSRGEVIDTGDILIAAIVITNNETLATRNIKHFERITDLRITPL